MMRNLLIGSFLLTAAFVVIVPPASAECGAADVPCQLICTTPNYDGTGAVGCLVEQTPLLMSQKRDYHGIANCVYDVDDAWGDCQ